MVDRSHKTGKKEHHAGKMQELFKTFRIQLVKAKKTMHIIHKSHFCFIGTF